MWRVVKMSYSAFTVCLGEFLSLQPSILIPRCPKQQMVLRSRSEFMVSVHPRCRAFFSSLTAHLRIRPSSTARKTGTTTDGTMPVGDDVPAMPVSYTTTAEDMDSLPPFVPALKKFRIRSDMLLSPLFAPWILGLLRFASGTLQELKFECSVLLPSSARHIILSSVSFPTLEKLEIMADGPVFLSRHLVIDSEDILTLLSRCPALEDPALYGLRPSMSPYPFKGLHVPRLRSFDGHPSLVKHLLELRLDTLLCLGRVVLVDLILCRLDSTRDSRDSPTRITPTRTLLDTFL
ncbi:hypothetical protein BKA70DRAFT_250320 [Coprinopsis sp. MPI-PUGE-AT-0042]|nr:hypothetical protein BKA70DRAFT_250320 [Coprinopsis sp. MPI-PUGE-AT-0042]